MQNQTFAIVTSLYLEHNYINFFIEYHLALGFNKFYVMIDDSTGPEDEYIIFDELKPYVNLIKYSDLYDKEYTKNWLENMWHKMELVHRVIINNIYPMVTEDYVMLLGCDSFLFLDNLTVKEYFIKNNITDDIAQIFFRWKDVRNFSFTSNYNLFENMNTNDMEIFDGDQYYTMAKRSLVLRPSDNSHHYFMLNDGKGFYENKIINVTAGIGEEKYYEIRPHIINNEPFNTGVLHVTQRDFQNAVTKGVMFWEKTKNWDEIYKKTSHLIKNMIQPGRWCHRYCNTSYLKFDFRPSQNNIENYKYSETIFNEIIKNCDVTREEVYNWVSNCVKLDFNKIDELFIEVENEKRCY